MPLRVLACCLLCCAALRLRLTPPCLSFAQVRTKRLGKNIEKIAAILEAQAEERLRALVLSNSFAAEAEKRCEHFEAKAAAAEDRIRRAQAISQQAWTSHQKVQDAEQTRAASAVQDSAGGENLRAALLSPSGSFRAYTFWTLSEARSRLYQRRFLRSRAHFSAFFKLFIFSFAPFQISLIFQDLCTIFCKI